MNMERANLLTAARWAGVGPMFDEQPRPQIADLTRLCSIVARACVEVEPVFARLLEDGGISRQGHVTAPEALLTALCVQGVVRRVSLGRRDHRRPVKRYALTPDYRQLIDAITGGLVCVGATRQFAQSLVEKADTHD